MEHLGHFIINHWILWLALIVVGVFILTNERQIKQKRAEEVSPQSTVNLMNHEGATIIDLRELEAFNKGHIINSIHISAANFEQNIKKYKDKPIILVCDKGLSSTQQAAKLKQEGFVKPMVLTGGISAWEAANLPLVKK